MRTGISASPYGGASEVSQGYWAEFGPNLTYYGSHLRDPQHGLWVVFLTEWCIKVAATLLWETYDCWHLWHLPAKLIAQMHLLDFSVPLGGPDLNREIHSLLDMIEGVDWDCVPAQNFSRSFTRQRPSFSPGRNHSAAGDFVWISMNPWSSTSAQHGKLNQAVDSETKHRFPILPQS